MKTYFTPLLITGSCLIWIVSLLSTSVHAQDKVKIQFYCDRTNNGEPVTVIRRYDRGNPSPSKIEMVVWRKNPKTAVKRCESISGKMQSMWDTGHFSTLGNGLNSNGQGMICALSSPSSTCNNSNLLFTVKNLEESKEIIDRVRKPLLGKLLRPIEQSGDGLSTIDIQDVIKALSAPKK